MDLKIGGDSDLAIEMGDLALVDGVDAIAQHLRVRLRMFRGEWFLDERVGMPFYQSIFVKAPNLAVIRSIYKKAILTTQGVLGIDELKLDLNRALRQLTVTLRARTTAGPLTFLEESVIDMTTYGVTSTGFVRKDLDTIKTELEASLKAQLGDGINLLPSSVFGQLVGILAEREAELWDVSEAVYASQYPASASNQSLDNVCQLTGVARLAATKSTVTLKCNLNAGVTLTVGRVVSVSGHPDVRFVTLAEITNSGGAPANVNVAAECEDAGPVAAAAGTLTVIETPVAGWNSATNDLDAEPGRNLETDAELRARRNDLLRSTGSSPVEAIRSRLLEVAGVTAAFVFDNTTDATNGDGMPPHSVEAVVLGGTNADVAACLWANVAGGIQTHGTTSVSVTDSQGFAHTVKLSRPTSKNIYAIIDVTTDADFPVDGDDQIMAAVVEHGDAMVIGADVVTAQLYQHIFEISGVVDVTKVWVGLASPPTAPDNIVIGSRELAVWDTSRITVNVT